MNGAIDNQLRGLTIANREKEAVDDYIRDNLLSLDDFAEIQSAYPVFFCGVAGVNPMPLRQQQRYASQRIMQASLVTLIPHNRSPLSMHAAGHRVVGSDPTLPYFRPSARYRVQRASRFPTTCGPFPSSVGPLTMGGQKSEPEKNSTGMPSQTGRISTARLGIHRPLYSSSGLSFQWGFMTYLCVHRHVEGKRLSSIRVRFDPCRGIGGKRCRPRCGRRGTCAPSKTTTLPSFPPVPTSPSPRVVPRQPDFVRRAAGKEGRGGVGGWRSRFKAIYRFRAAFRGRKEGGSPPPSKVGEEHHPKAHELRPHRSARAGTGGPFGEGVEGEPRGPGRQAVGTRELDVAPD